MYLSLFSNKFLSNICQMKVNFKEQNYVCENLILHSTCKTLLDIIFFMISGLQKIDKSVYKFNIVTSC